MVTKEQISRINELYKKQQSEGLTEEEKNEQILLRRLYIDSMKENLRSQLKNIKIVDPEEYEKEKNKNSCDCDECKNGHDHHHNHEHVEDDIQDRHHHTDTCSCNKEHKN